MSIHWSFSENVVSLKNKAGRLIFHQMTCTLSVLECTSESLSSDNLVHTTQYQTEQLLQFLFGSSSVVSGSLLDFKILEDEYWCRYWIYSQLVKSEGSQFFHLITC